MARTEPSGSPGVGWGAEPRTRRALARAECQQLLLTIMATRDESEHHGAGTACLNCDAARGANVTPTLRIYSASPCRTRVARVAGLQRTGCGPTSPHTRSYRGE